jgi:peptidoglycan/LPS O-acetylase OafA/YrhL
MSEVKIVRLSSIDFLRGCAALAVVVHHAITYSAEPPTNIAWFRWIHTVLSQGWLGVPLFFVISGFCIHLQSARQKKLRGSYAISFLPFWKRRIFRLYPPYFVALTLSMGLVVTAYLLHKSVPLVTIYPEPKLKWMLADFIVHTFMLHGFHPFFDKAGGNPPFWTLAREEYFYALYFVLLVGLQKIGAKASVFLVLLLGFFFPSLMSFVVPSQSPWWDTIASSALALWIQWCLGMLAVEAYFELATLPQWCYSPMALLAWLLLAYSVGREFSFFAPALWGMVFFTLLNYCVRLEKENKWPSKNRLVAWVTGVGAFSYSLYLVHNQVRAVLKQLLGRLAITERPIVYLWITLLFTVAACFAAKLFFYLVERHFLISREKSAKEALA